ncbi:hypothetical protein [Austwickia chelonae]|uniref:hypothetical protein n=1 Tax=Austwickia chelonae TaxID=100225 RepID=UPI000E239060|nr:hypothetical protein [Austwickia chelonae]
MCEIVQTDSRGRVALSGRKNQYFLKTELPDGTVVLKPGQFVTDAQREYETCEELRGLLSEAAPSPTVRHARRSA